MSESGLMYAMGGGGGGGQKICMEGMRNLFGRGRREDLIASKCLRAGAFVDLSWDVSNVQMRRRR